MVILRGQNKITDFLMILAWASPFKSVCWQCGLSRDVGVFLSAVLQFVADLFASESLAQRASHW